MTWVKKSNRCTNDGQTEMQQPIMLPMFDFIPPHMLHNVYMMDPNQGFHPSMFDGGAQVPLGPILAPTPGAEQQQPAADQEGGEAAPINDNNKPARRTKRKRRRVNSRSTTRSNTGTVAAPKKTADQLQAHRQIEQRRRSKVASLQSQLRDCVLRRNPALLAENVHTKADILQAAINLLL